MTGREMIRQHDEGDYTFCSVLTRNGRVRLLIRPHAYDRDGREMDGWPQRYDFTPLEARALISCLDIIPDDNG